MNNLSTLDSRELLIIRKELYEKHKNSSVKEKIEIIVNDDKYPPEYYPVKWAILSYEELSKLPRNMIHELYDRLCPMNRKKKGPWKKLNLLLKESFIRPLIR